MKILNFALILSFFLFCSFKPVENPRPRWTVEQANEWAKTNGWMCGSNFIPSTAINQLEMWQADTFDPSTIDQELGWAEGLGMNVMRVFLHHLAWEQDKPGFKSRMDKFLDIAAKHHIKIMFVFFDDCWLAKSKIGKQPEPVLGKHNSGWLKDPGIPMNADTTIFPGLEKYVKDVMNSFAKDKRIVIWDLYNEPNTKNNQSLNLLKKVFQWARETKATQPITSGIWKKELKDYTKFQTENSDIISYHNYGDAKLQKKTIDSLRIFNRPLICSEYMARKKNSLFQTVLPVLHRENVTAINWGLVSGKTNTIYAWGDTTHRDGSEPALWFHDIFRKGGIPYKQEEVDAIRKECLKK